MERELKDIVATLESTKRRKKGCALLIGAGCSVKAGIPTAPGLVERIKEDHPVKFERAEQKTYQACMAELHWDERRDLIAGYVDAAKINWAHICIALLMQAGYVDRVLTTNFDLLITQAAALLGQFPASYDLATSQVFRPDAIVGKAVFYLHGRYTGFVLTNTQEEIESQSELVGPAFEAAGSARTWIVVGYSGENDPVFDNLASVPNFDNGLHWVGYQDNEPAEHVRSSLLDANKDACFVKGFDADSFFIALTQQLGIFPPPLITRPFDHLDDILGMLTPYPVGGEAGEEDVTTRPREAVRQAAEEYEREASTDADAQRLLMEGDYKEVIAQGETTAEPRSPQLIDAMYWAYIEQGIQSRKKADARTGQEADRLYALAGEKYQGALKIKPEGHEALYNWGIALLKQAKTKGGEEADRFFGQAGEKYEAALAIKPDKDEALNNWGNALLGQAKTKEGEEADGLYTLAGEKYEAALAIKPDDHEVLNNWGNVLLGQAKTKEGEEADGLYTLAGEKYEAALAIKPDNHQALDSWGTALIEQAKTKDGEKADRLYGLAREKCLGAESLRPGTGAYNLACVSALQGDDSGCREWLEKRRDAGTLPSREHLEKDSDLDGVRETDWFRELLDALD